MNSKTNGEEDGDSVFLEHVLDKLYDFGNGPASKKKLKSQKKKKRKRYEEEEDEEELPAVKDVHSDAEDRVDHVGIELQQKQPKTEQTGPSSRQVSQVEVVTFQDPRKKLKTKQTPTLDKVPALQTTTKKQSDELEELSLEKARLEVHRFGITGYKKEQQRVFEQDRAVMLGARDLKKKKKQSNPRSGGPLQERHADPQLQGDPENQRQQARQIGEPVNPSRMGKYKRKRKNRHLSADSAHRRTLFAVPRGELNAT
ncbi:hypothetical protein D5F01_LYC14558 [Larimichthys crocea]|uniref:Uncharacterized protein n=1 Tax=Larimichthys crocea TaxID=215358 RepID=A0A6G0I573_LARCR|nr:hypothetical protein D5F01_LYC14558 [Larimichthys crocea]